MKRKEIEILLNEFITKSQEPLDIFNFIIISGYSKDFIKLTCWWYYLNENADPLKKHVEEIMKEMINEVSFEDIPDWFISVLECQLFPFPVKSIRQLFLKKAEDLHFQLSHQLSSFILQ